jgi:UDP-N-acetylmuramoyl-tripeptide--D-alanyl-D-alanine ligase
VDGVCFLNKDNAYIREYAIKNTCKKVWFSMLTEADYQVVNMYQTSEITQFTVLVDGMYYEFETRLLGKHNVMNLLAMISVAHTLGMDMAILQNVVKHMPCIEHRLERKDFHGRTLIDNSYSSNIESMKESLEILSMMPNKKIIITPGLVDLAYMVDETHYQFGSLMKEKVDIVILVGESQTSMIYNGLIENGFSEENIYIVNSMAEGLSKSLEVSEVNDTILIENDLPAVYMAASDIKKGGK